MRIFMGPGGFGPPMRYKYERIAPPKGLSDVPRYLKELLGGFFTRLFYIFALVWKTGPWILFLMSFIAISNGVMPVITALISKNILNELQGIIELHVTKQSVEFWGSAVMFLIIFLFIFRILNKVIHNINNAVTRIAGEKVVKQVKLQIMEKASELDLASFDIPGFYEKLENANREAGVRPISIISSTFSIISSLIEFISYIIVLATAPGLWWAVLVIIGVSVPSAIINFIYKRKHFNYIRRRSKDRRQMNYYSDLMVNKDMVKEVRMFDLSDTFIGKYKEVFGHYYTGLRKLIINENVWHIIIAIVSSGVICSSSALSRIRCLKEI